MGKFVTMYKVILSTLFCLGFITVNALTVNFHHGLFMTSDRETYVETYMLFDGSDMRYVSVADSMYQAKIELTYVFEQNGKVIDFSKTYVNSPITNDTIEMLSDFTDQQRFVLPPGKYDLLIMLKDVNHPTDTVRSVQSIVVDLSPNDAGFSDIYFIERTSPTVKPNMYTRNGLDYFPRLSSFYPPAANEIWFYAELYNTSLVFGDDTPYLITTEILNPETGDVVDQYRSLKRMKSAPVQGLAQKLNIANLPTGSYVLKLEARNKDNVAFASQSRPFKRYSDNKMDLSTVDVKKTFVNRMSEDSLRSMTYCLIWQATDQETRYIEENWKTGDTTDLARFFYEFWYERNPLDTRLEWARYHQNIKHVSYRYSNSTMHGCQTDRGRVYLKYGEPNSRSEVRNEAHSYPYEIWHYYKVPGKSNAKFFFLDNRRMNEYILGHSNVMGEPTDRLWYTRVVRETEGGSQSTFEHQQEAVIQERDPYSHGSRALDYWNNPR
ncbi:MAG: hypothetical protein Salg2KO_12620 [Salibacteraceae bacterium]